MSSRYSSHTNSSCWLAGRTRRTVVGLPARANAPQQHLVVHAQTAVLEGAASTRAETSQLFYDGVIFDMDGTCTESHIDFADMRARTGIPVGDLFTVMEAWEDDSRIAAAMNVILEIEAGAAAVVSAKPGLMKLLELLRDRQVPVALVTRNTSYSVDAFFKLIGPEWQRLFSQVLTREFPYVKPDKRLLLHVAQEWGLEPSRLLMVGDSFEDIECGNAAGTATCMIKVSEGTAYPVTALLIVSKHETTELGGGNEKPGANITPPPGGVPTFDVSSLTELAERLQDASEAGPSSAGLGLALGWPARLQAGESMDTSGAPPPGLDLLDWLGATGGLRSAQCSFPRMGRAAGGLATCSTWGDRVLHIFCGSAALTKLLASQGMQVVAIDTEVAAVQRRGLQAVAFNGVPLAPGSLDAALTHGSDVYDAVLLDGLNMPSDLESRWWMPGTLQQLRPLLVQGGRLCVQVPLTASVNPAAILSALAAGGWSVAHWRIADAQPGCTGLACSQQLQLVAALAA